MRTYEEALAAAKDEPAFSNGTEGECWMDNWCYECANDSPEMVDRGEGCPLIMVALMQRTPAEWIEQPWGQIKGRPEGETAPSLSDRYHCTEFRKRPEPGEEPAEPPPAPVIEGQVDMFEVFADQVVERSQVVHA